MTDPYMTIPVSDFEELHNKIKDLETKLERAEKDRDNGIAAFNEVAATSDKLEHELEQAEKQRDALTRALDAAMQYVTPKDRPWIAALRENQ
jgi:exonuclease VII small subunit